MKLYLSQLVTNLAPNVLGDGRPGRIGIWTQGCSLGRKGSCKGCMSQFTHNEGGTEISVANLMRRIELHNQSGGMTISGGEPTDQAQAIQALLKSYKEKYPLAPIIMYSGRTLSWIKKNQKDSLENLDVLIAGLFLQNRAPNALAGSDNQRVHLLTALAQQAFADWPTWPRRQQIMQSTGELVVLGIPDREQIDQLSIIHL